MQKQMIRDDELEQPQQNQQSSSLIPQTSNLNYSDLNEFSNNIRQLTRSNADIVTKASRPASSLTRTHQTPRFIQIDKIEHKQLDFEAVQPYKFEEQLKIHWKDQYDYMYINDIRFISTKCIENCINCFIEVANSQNQPENLHEAQLRAEDAFEKLLGIPSYIIKLYSKSNKQSLISGEMKQNNQQTTSQQQLNLKINELLQIPQIQENNNIWTNDRLTNNDLKQITPFLLTKANKLAAIGQASNAIDKLTSATKGTIVMQPSEQTFNLLQLSHQFTPNLPKLVSTHGPPLMNQVSNKLTIHLISKQIYSLKSSASPGPSGWTSDTLKKLTKGNKPFTTLIHLLFTSMIGSRYYPECLFTSSCIAIKKKDNPNPRPIAIMEVWTKLLARIFLTIDKDAYKRSIPNTQFGVGIKRGCEKTAAIIGAAIDLSRNNPEEQLIIIQTDINQAFPSVNHQILMNILTKAELSEANLDFHLALLQKSKLIHFTKQQFFQINSNQGILQGNPLSPSDFALYSASLINSFNNSNPLPTCIGYLDDLILTIKGMQNIQPTFQTLTSELQKIHLSLNINKCKIILAQNGKIQQTNQQLQLGQVNFNFSSYLKVLGIIISNNQQDKDNQFIKQATNALRVAHSLPLLYTQSGIILARQCVASKLSRIIQSQCISRNLLDQFDERLEILILSIIQSKPDIYKRLISFPINEGGLGIMKLSETYKSALLSTWLQIIQSFPLNNLLINSGLQNINDKESTNKFLENRWDTNASRIFEFLDQWTNNTTNQEQDLVKNGGQHALWAFELQAKIFQFKNQLQINPHLLKRLIANTSHLASHWLRCTGSNRQTRLTNAETQYSINYFLLSTYDEQTTYDQFHFKSSPYCLICSNKLDNDHYTCCQSLQSERSARHHQIKSCLAQTFMGIRGVTVSVEKGLRITNQNNSTHLIIPDITITVLAGDDEWQFEKDFTGGKATRTLLHHFTIAIDVSISQDQNAFGKNSTQQELAAHLEQLKLNKYRNWDQQTLGYRVIPFGLTSSGTLGKYAQGIINLMHEIQQRNKVQLPIDNFQKCISIILRRSLYSQWHTFNLISSNKINPINNILHDLSTASSLPNQTDRNNLMHNIDINQIQFPLQSLTFNNNIAPLTSRISPKQNKLNNQISPLKQSFLIPQLQSSSSSSPTLNSALQQQKTAVYNVNNLIDKDSTHSFSSSDTQQIIDQQQNISNPSNNNNNNYKQIPIIKFKNNQKESNYLNNQFKKFNEKLNDLSENKSIIEIEDSQNNQQSLSSDLIFQFDSQIYTSQYDKLYPYVQIQDSYKQQNNKQHSIIQINDSQININNKQINNQQKSLSIIEINDSQVTLNNNSQTHSIIEIDSQDTIHKELDNSSDSIIELKSLSFLNKQLDNLSKNNSIIEIDDSQNIQQSNINFFETDISLQSIHNIYNNFNKSHSTIEIDNSQSQNNNQQIIISNIQPSTDQISHSSFKQLKIKGINELKQINPLFILQQNQFNNNNDDLQLLPTPTQPTSKSLFQRLDKKIRKKIKKQLKLNKDLKDKHNKLKRLHNHSPSQKAKKKSKY